MSSFNTNQLSSALFIGIIYLYSCHDTKADEYASLGKTVDVAIAKLSSLKL